MSASRPDTAAAVHTGFLFQQVEQAAKSLSYPTPCAWLAASPVSHLLQLSNGYVNTKATNSTVYTLRLPDGASLSGEASGG